MHWLLRHHHARTAGLGQSLYRSYFNNLFIRIEAATEITPEDPFHPFLVELKIVDATTPEFPQSYKLLHCKSDPQRKVYSCGSLEKIVIGSAVNAVVERAASRLPIGTAFGDTLFDGHIVFGFNRLFLDGLLYTSLAYARTGTSRRDSSVIVYTDAFGDERPAVVHAYFTSKATQLTYAVIEDLVWYDDLLHPDQDREETNPLSRPVPELSSALYFARPRNDAPLNTIDVLSIKRRLMRFQPSGLTYRGFPAVALCEFVYVVPGSEVAPEHDQRQAREQM